MQVSRIFNKNTVFGHWQLRGPWQEEMLKEVNRLSPQNQIVCVNLVDYLQKNSPYHTIVYTGHSCLKATGWGARSIFIKPGLFFNKGILNSLKRMKKAIVAENERIKVAVLNNQTPEI